MGMAGYGWDRAVVVQAGRYGHVRYTLSDTVKAAEILAHHWPHRVEKGPKYRRACLMCIAVVEKGADPEKARKAFVEAAKDAGLLVSE
jgi:hypothetical protein